jgi:hypothetical protein
MSAPTRISKQKYIPITLALPAAATAATAWIPVRGRRLSIPASWTGTPTGTFSIQALGADGVTPVSIPGASAEFTNAPNAQPAGAAGSALWNFSNVPGSAVRILYTAAGSTGVLSIAPVWAD